MIEKMNSLVLECSLRNDPDGWFLWISARGKDAAVIYFRYNQKRIGSDE